MKVIKNLDVLQVMQTVMGDGGVAPVKVTFTDGFWVPPAGFVVAKLTCTGGTKIVIDWEDDSAGETLLVENLVLPAGALVIPIVNVKRIVQANTDAENLVAWPLVY